MLILHASWLAAETVETFFIWGEVAADAEGRKGRRRAAPRKPAGHPAQAPTSSLLTAARLSTGSGVTKSSALARLPTDDGQPLTARPLSAQGDAQPTLADWVIDGLALTAPAALSALVTWPTAAAPGVTLGADLRFWIAAARFALELLARQRYIPTLEEAGKTVVARWQPTWVDADEQARFQWLLNAMPPACRSLRPANAAWRPIGPLTLLTAALTTWVDQQVRAWAGPVQRALPRRLAPGAVRSWIDALFSPQPQVSGASFQLSGLVGQINRWLEDLQQATTAGFRVSFQLATPPAAASPGERSWVVHYLLQATDDPSLLVPAEQVWQEASSTLTLLNRRLLQPQERLLSGLAKAARLFAPLEQTLRAACPSSVALTTPEAYTFLREAAPLLEQSGFGILTPPWWQKRAAALGVRLKLKQKQTASEASGLLSFAKVVEYDWQLALGEDPLTQEEFERLAALKSPLVNIRGQWVEFRPEQVEAAIRFWEKRRAQGELGLLDAMHLALGDGEQGAVDGLPVTHVALDAWLQDLFQNLSHHDQMQPLPAPSGFVGTLRPYQERGLAWLVFLRRVGLGGCLADDMGLGKCLSAETLVTVNGAPLAAETLWDTYAGEAYFDGEGFWAQPRASLHAQARQEADGRLVAAPVQRLYRQQVQEPLRTITLANGCRITITRRHRLLTPAGWTNDLQVGDAVCVTPPAGGEPGQVTVFSAITAIEPVPYTGWVYDLEIAGRHNFVANGIVCHNTIQTIGMVLHGREQNPQPDPVLLICPTSVLGNWEREIQRFAPSLRVLVHQGANRLGGEEFVTASQQTDVVVSSYSLLARDRELLGQVAWGDVILDEAQNIKNPTTKQAQAARGLAARHRLALTGTPVENRLTDLWSIMEFLNPGYLGSQQSFRSKFTLPIERYHQPEPAAQLKTLVQPLLLRRVKSDPTIIQDLPEKNEMKVYCNLTAEQATLYEAVVKDSLRQIEESEGMQRRGLVLSTLMKLKQVCNHPAHFLGNRTTSDLAGRSGKLNRLSEMLEEVLSVNDSALIFSQFFEMGEMLVQHLTASFGEEPLFLHGGVPARQRDEMVKLFQSGNGPRLFMLSLKAGGVGLNLTQANHVFHFDRWWNPAVENQATDRAFRIGQQRNVQVHKFICAGTLEEKIDQLIESKKELANSIVGAGESWLTELSTAQLRDLLVLRQDAVATEEGV
ncbi:MAG: SNF2-related protein [Anaerolineae bacterium]